MPHPVRHQGAPAPLCPAPRDRHPLWRGPLPPPPCSAGRERQRPAALGASAQRSASGVMLTSPGDSHGYRQRTRP
jgi:hypothetical protein